MKKSIIIVSFLALVAASCSKENQVVVNNSENNVAELVPMTFSANLPETRTVLNDHKVIWSADDMLNVIEVDAEGNLVGEHPFTLSGGDGTNSATFTGEVVSGSNSFYAVYPNQKLYNSPETVGLTIELKTLGQAVDAVENGYDPKMAVMTAVVDESGNLAFRHAMAYIKFTANSSDIASVKVTASGDARIYGRPVINLSDGTPNTVAGTSGNSNLTMSGTFVSGSTYYFPITIKADKALGKLSFVATNSAGATSEVSTTALSSLKPVAGTIYNLGTIPFSFAPAIKVTAPAKLEFDATEGSFEYEVLNPVEGQSITASLEEGVDWISDIVVNDDAVTFTCETNDTSAERSAVITLSYDGADNVPVTITQKNEGTIVLNSYVWDFSADDASTSFSVSDSQIYKYESGSFTVVESADENDVLYACPNGKTLKMEKKGSYVVLSDTSGADAYMLLNIDRKGSLKIWATLNKKPTETLSGDTNLNVVIDGNKNEKVVNERLDTSSSEEYLGAGIYTWAIDGSSSVSRVEIHKSGKHGLHIFKIEFVEE